MRVTGGYAGGARLPCARRCADAGSGPVSTTMRAVGAASVVPIRTGAAAGAGSASCLSDAALSATCSACGRGASWAAAWVAEGAQQAHQGQRGQHPRREAHDPPDWTGERAECHETKTTPFERTSHPE
ncbi:hypothetical protein ACFQZ4_16165 [Catellatospora coxensis]